MSAPLATKEQVAALLGVHPKTVERWGVEGRIPRYKVGDRAVRYDVDEVRAALLVHEGGAA